MSHIPVLLDEVICGLKINPDGIYIDGTVGGGGHSFEIAKKLSQSGYLFCIDRDKSVLKKTEIRLYKFQDKISFIHENFSKLKKIAEIYKIDQVDGILFDLGVSSFQIDDASRGFSYIKDAPLDMRMDQSQEKSAYDMVNFFEVKQLSDIIKKYGEERFHKQIAQKIISSRKKSPIKTTLQLVKIIESAIPNKILNRNSNSHPAKKTFQAIRIAVNNELEILEQTIIDSIDLLKTGGRLCVITFHSLEDRIIKNIFKKLENPCICPRDFPFCVCGKKPICKIITKKPICPSQNELKNNPRAHSAKLRIIEKI